MSIRLVLLFTVISKLFLTSKGFTQLTNSRGKLLQLNVKAQEQYVVELVRNEDRVLDVAAFWNGLMNPQMIVERAQAKRNSIDKWEAALDGLKIGTLFIGPFRQRLELLFKTSYLQLDAFRLLLETTNLIFRRYNL